MYCKRVVWIGDSWHAEPWGYCALILQELLTKWQIGAAFA
jgi:hypothetical protein|tara:strand:+ start:791 stop:910 length:120 start_codon:yes stop_codon:yes gene_type:complete